jgi:hypothetical protein
VFRHPLGGLRRGASLGRKIHHARRALVYAMAFVLGVFRRLCVAVRVLEHCHKNSGALVRLAVRDHDVSFCGDVDISREFSPTPETGLHGRLVIREMSFAGGGWILAGNAMREQGRGKEGKSKLITVGRVLIAIAAIFFGVEHFLHPANMPRSAARKTDACVDSGAPAHWLSDGRNSSGCRGQAFCWARRRG